MASPKPESPPRFVVQCAKGKGWKTLVVDEQQAAAEHAFREIIKIKPRGFFRLIRLDDKPGVEIPGQEFTWKLLQLHDPRQGGAVGVNSSDSTPKAGAPAKTSSRPRPRARPQSRQPPVRSKGRSERVAVPVRLYVMALVLGAVAAAMLFLLYGMPEHGPGNGPVPLR